MIIVYWAISIALALLVLWLLWRYGKARNWFAGSETVFGARVLWIGGLFLQTVQVLDPTTLTSLFQLVGLGAAAPRYAIAAGILFEVLRKARTEGGVLGNDLTPKP